MPRVDEWERKLLGNLAGSVRIDPDERVLLVRSFDWYHQDPRERNDTYESRIHDNWPNWVGDAREAEDRILHRTIHTFVEKKYHSNPRPREITPLHFIPDQLVQREGVE
jgi:hypothetical protein